MKKILVILMLVLTFHLSNAHQPFFANNTSTENHDFKLHYMKLGFGQNMYRMQPIFVVNNKQFVYTMEDVWAYPGQTTRKDTLAMGKFRQTSIDSIINIVYNTQDSCIQKHERYMGGAATYINIETGNKKLKIDLSNATDPIAKNIINIIDTYMQKKFSALDD